MFMLFTTNIVPGLPPHAHQANNGKTRYESCLVSKLVRDGKLGMPNKPIENAIFLLGNLSIVIHNPKNIKNGRFCYSDYITNSTL